MKQYKVLNLYACLGGNRFKWDEVAKAANVDLKVTAVELDAHLSKLYQDRFPNDTVIIADAHQYLLENYQDFDFIWSSPPCPTHSRIRISQKNRKTFTPKFPDMKLYEEIIFLDNHFDGKYCVENVLPYYNPLIHAKKRGRHLYWTNFNLPNNVGERKVFKNIIEKGDTKELSEFHDYDFTKYKGNQRLDKIARNLVDYEAGKTILQTVLKVYQSNHTNQTSIYDYI